jgi:predicted phosphatase
MLLYFLYEVLHDTAKFIKLMILVVVVGALCWILLHKSIEVLRNLAILSFFQSSLFSAAKHLLGVGWILR